MSIFAVPTPTMSLEGEQLAVFHVGELILGLPISGLSEIQRVPELTAVPLTPPVIRGLLHLRGDMVAVVDIGLLLHGTPLTRTRQSRILLLQGHGERLGLLVDRMGDVTAGHDGELEPPPANLPACLARMAQGVFRRRGELLVIMAVERLMEHDWWE